MFLGDTFLQTVARKMSFISPELKAKVDDLVEKAEQGGLVRHMSTLLPLLKKFSLFQNRNVFIFIMSVLNFQCWPRVLNRRFFQSAYWLSHNSEYIG